MENQTTLMGEGNNNIIKLMAFSLNKKSILGMFYKDYTEMGLSLVEIKRNFAGNMSDPTMERTISQLKFLGFIHIVLRNMGPTKRRKYYKITEKGAIFYERMGKPKV